MDLLVQNQLQLANARLVLRMRLRPQLFISSCQSLWSVSQEEQRTKINEIFKCEKMSKDNTSKEVKGNDSVQNNKTIFKSFFRKEKIESEEIPEDTSCEEVKIKDEVQSKRTIFKSFFRKEKIESETLPKGGPCEEGKAEVELPTKNILFKLLFRKEKVESLNDNTKETSEQTNSNAIEDKCTKVDQASSHFSIGSVMDDVDEEDGQSSNQSTWLASFFQ